MLAKRRILLVDDEVSITRALALYLTTIGNCDVRVENAGARALATAREFRPELILLDVVMPDVDGGSVAAAIGADPELRGTPIVFLTALVSQQEARRSGSHINGHRCLAKPIAPDTLLACIEEEVTRRYLATQSVSRGGA